MHYETERGDENEDQKNVRKVRREKLKNKRNEMIELIFLGVFFALKCLSYSAEL